MEATTYFEYFSSDDFKCSCGCGFNIIDHNLVHALDALRAKVGRPFIVNSGCRCPDFNSSERVKGAKNSYHTKGKAVDISTWGFNWQDIETIKDFCEERLLSLIIYNGFVHIDNREGGRYFKDKRQ